MDYMDYKYDFLNELIQGRVQKTYKRNIVNIDPIIISHFIINILTLTSKITIL